MNVRQAAGVALAGTIGFGAVIGALKMESDNPVETGAIAAGGALLVGTAVGTLVSGGRASFTPSLVAAGMGGFGACVLGPTLLVR